MRSMHSAAETAKHKGKPSRGNRKQQPTCCVLTLLAFFSVGLAGCERAKDPQQKKGVSKIGLVLAVGGLGDQSVNDSAYAGLQQARDKLSVDIQHIEPRDASEFQDHLDNLARGGCKLIFGIGFSMKQPIETVAKRHQDTMFAIIDVPAEGENVVSLIFREQEGAYLAGALAALMTHSSRIGFVGGMDIPLLRKWQFGFEDGAKMIAPNIHVDVRFVDVAVRGFSDPVRAKEVALSMYSQDVDVILQVTGGSAAGIYGAAKEASKWAIGSDQDQDDAAPGRVLTSVKRNLEPLVVQTVKRYLEGDLKGEIQTFGLKENGISLTDFRHTASVIGEEKLDRIRKLAHDISQGKIAVQDRSRGD